MFDGFLLATIHSVSDSVQGTINVDLHRIYVENKNYRPNDGNIHSLRPFRGLLGDIFRCLFESMNTSIFPMTTE